MPARRAGGGGHPCSCQGGGRLRRWDGPGACPGMGCNGTGQKGRRARARGSDRGERHGGGGTTAHSPAPSGRRRLECPAAPPPPSPGQCPGSRGSLGWSPGGRNRRGAMALAPTQPHCRRRDRTGRRLPLSKRSNVCAGGGPREGRGRGVGRGGLIANGSGYVVGGREPPASGADPRKRQKLGTASLLPEGSFVAASSSGLIRFLLPPPAPARRWIQPGREL